MARGNEVVQRRLFDRMDILLAIEGAENQMAEALTEVFFFFFFPFFFSSFFFFFFFLFFFFFFFFFFFSFFFPTGLVRLYIAGLPLSSCHTIRAPSVKGSAQCAFFSFLVAAGFEPTYFSLGSGHLNHYPILIPNLMSNLQNRWLRLGAMGCSIFFS